MGEPRGTHCMAEQHQPWTNGYVYTSQSYASPHSCGDAKMATTASVGGGQLWRSSLGKGTFIPLLRAKEGSTWAKGGGF